MSRRVLILAIPAAALGQSPDLWKQLADVWNPFAEKINHGVVDLKLWKKVVAAIDRIEGRNFKGEPK